jgi:formate hydrogenlyase subunit 6/NADH:ubiquinone oxidoreductase subunit I
VVNVFRRSLKTGVVTRRYPAEPEPAPDSFRGQVQFDPSACCGEAACARSCPSNAIQVALTETGWIWSLTDTRCVFCGLCAEACPSGAIALTNEFELAVLDRRDLVTTVSITRGATS